MTQYFNKRPFGRLGFIVLFFFALFSSPAFAEWGWYVVSPATESGRNNLKFLFSGMGTTILLSLTALSISITSGALVALLALSKYKPLKWINIGYVEVVRAVPLLVLLLWVYYGLPVLFGVSIDPFWAAVIALSISDSAFEAEIFRGAIQSIDKGQAEAAKSIGLNPFWSFVLVILPQAMRRILPPLGNQLVYMLKMSSLASIIGLTELTRRANELSIVEYRPLEIYSILVLEYLLIILVVSALVRRIERKLARNDR